MIYFVRSHATGYIKIGYTTNFEDRVLLLSAEFGALDLLGLMNGDRQTERNMHWKFGRQLVRFHSEVEWFQSSDELLQYIKENATLHIPALLHAKARVQRKPSGDALLNALRVKEARDGCIYDPYEVARGLRISPSIVGRLMAGKPYGISRRNMKRVIDWLGCTIDDLLPSTGEPSA